MKTQGLFFAFMLVVAPVQAGLNARTKSLIEHLVGLLVDGYLFLRKGASDKEKQMAVLDAVGHVKHLLGMMGEEEVRRRKEEGENIEELLHALLSNPEIREWLRKSAHKKREELALM